MPFPPADKDACELLDDDHLAVKHLFVEYARLAMAANQESAAQRGTLAAKICAELTVHAQIEEEIFYPALEAARADALSLLQEAREEHEEAKALVERIQAQGGPADAAMDDLVAKLASAVEHHVKEERDELFPKAKATPGLDLVALAAQMKERQEALQAAAPA